ncbi:uncharacterized protein LOC120569614 isoform X2 [Perca fluviatilis]|uniref:uncharacterized protein LOC120569614 isoform X2 n=1 Tax=Perca fluviatilis TaxID=8168 RepID=UPI0019626173|nr:uncharacterized protein LOC120569614 isoform X2 [Perca fluviatilis]
MDLGQKQTAAAEKLMALISGSRTRPVADSNSVVTDRTITNVKGNNFNMAVNTVSYPGSGPSGKAGGEVAQADCSARGGSVICTDRISDVHVDGDIDVSVTVKPKKILTLLSTLRHSRRDTAGLSGQETWWPPHSPPVSITSRAQGSSNSTHHKTRSTFHHHPLPDLQPALFPITSVYSGCLLTYIKRKTLNRASL